MRCNQIRRASGLFDSGAALFPGLTVVILGPTEVIPGIHRGEHRMTNRCQGLTAALELVHMWQITSETPMPKFSLSVNGRSHSVDVTPDTPLLWVLRDSLGLVGTKYGCGIGECGACTVHLNGVPTRSCQMQVSHVGNADVTTIEGLDPAGRHPLQQAWCELDVPQCGYCQAGQIMAAAALLKKNPRPDDAAIDREMDNLCRCNSYVRMRAGIKRAAELAAVSSGAKGGNS
jgi:isoquinoline 1-oxidoreductase alpha subunit